MFTPTSLNTRLLQAWLPAHVVLMVHGAYITDMADFVAVFVMYPMLCAVPLVIFGYLQANDENEEALDRLGIVQTENLNLAVVILSLLPLAFVIYAMVQAQLNRSYDSVSWIVIVFAGLIGLELGRKLKYRVSE
ncbi:MAG: hypothetical protein RKH07_07390 [Gammaproteobacteria bacterium]